MTLGQYLDLPTMAQLVLDGVVAHFDAAGVELPSHRFIAGGEPRQIAWDCPAVVVSSAGIVWGQGPGTGSATARGTGNPVSIGARHVVFAVQILRCVPVTDGEPPPAVELTQSGLAIMKDGGVLSQALVEMCGRGGVFQRYGTALAGAVEFLGPEGGIAASEGNVTVTAGRLV